MAHGTKRSPIDWGQQVVQVQTFIEVDVHKDQKTTPQRCTGRVGDTRVHSTCYWADNLVRGPEVGMSGQFAPTVLRVKTLCGSETLGGSACRPDPYRKAKDLPGIYSAPQATMKTCDDHCHGNDVATRVLFYSARHIQDTLVHRGQLPRPHSTVTSVLNTSNGPPKGMKGCFWTSSIDPK